MSYRLLQVASSPSVLLPRHSTEITITFIPTAAKEYAAAMPLRIMGLYDINIPLKGEHLLAVTLCLCLHSYEAEACQAYV